MATKTIKAAGGDYTSLSAWEAGEQANITGLGPSIAECYSMADTTAVVIAGWTTTAADYIRIYTPITERHDGKWNTAKYRLSVANATAILIQEDYVRLEGIQLEVNAANAANQFGISISGITATNNEIHISHTIARTHTNTSFTTNALSISDTDTIFKVWNCVFHHRGGTTSGSDRAVSISSATGWIYNCTVYGGQTGIRITGGTNVAKNTVFAGSGSNDISVTAGTLTCNYCITEDGTCPVDTGNQRNVTVASMVFADVTNTDFHIGATSTLEDQGTDLSADANLAFSDDIDGVARSGTWDVGADEITSSLTDIVGFSLIAAISISAIAATADVAGFTTTAATNLGTFSAQANIGGFSALSSVSLGNLIDLPSGDMAGFTFSCTTSLATITAVADIIGFSAIATSATGTLTGLDPFNPQWGLNATHYDSRGVRQHISQIRESGSYIGYAAVFNFGPGLSATFTAHRVVTIDVAPGASGSFTTVDGKTVTVVNGSITSIV